MKWTRETSKVGPRPLQGRCLVGTGTGLRSGAALVAVLGLIACASPTSETATPHAFERDKERCWLETTRALGFRCATGPCAVQIPDRLAFETCMQERGWELGLPQGADPEPPLAAPAPPGG